MEYTPEPLTKRRSAIHPILPKEEALAQSYRLKHCAPLTERLLLLRDGLDPLAVAYKCARPKRHLVVLAPQMYERNGESAFAINFNWNGRRVRCTTVETAFLRERFMPLASISRTMGVIGFICDMHEEELEGYWLRRG